MLQLVFLLKKVKLIKIFNWRLSRFNFSNITELLKRYRLLVFISLTDTVLTFFGIPLLIFASFHTLFSTHLKWKINFRHFSLRTTLIPRHNNRNILNFLLRIKYHLARSIKILILIRINLFPKIRFISFFLKRSIFIILVDILISRTNSFFILPTE